MAPGAGGRIFFQITVVSKQLLHRHLQQLLWILTDTGAEAELAADLPIQFPHTPPAADAFQLVEEPFKGIIDGENLSDVGEGKLRDQDFRVQLKSAAR